MEGRTLMKTFFTNTRKELAFALYATRMNLRSSAELRGSFIMNIVGMAINNTAFILLWVFFTLTVGEIHGWRAADIVGLLGFGTLSFGIVFSVCGGLRRTTELVASGAFDRFFLSPKNILIRLATSTLHVSAIGDAIFGVACLVFYAILIHASLAQIALMVLSVCVATLMWLAAAISIYSASFFFSDARNVTDGLFDLFLSPSIFHGGAFQGSMRVVFLFIIPALVIGTMPVELVRDVSIEKLLLITAIAVVWFGIALRLFNFGMRKYESANFMTFGQ